MEFEFSVSGADESARGNRVVFRKHDSKRDASVRRGGRVATSARDFRAERRRVRELDR